MIPQPKIEGLSAKQHTAVGRFYIVGYFTTQIYSIVIILLQVWTKLNWVDTSIFCSFFSPCSYSLLFSQYDHYFYTYFMIQSKSLKFLFHQLTRVKTPGKIVLQLKRQIFMNYLTRYANKLCLFCMNKTLELSLLKA